VWMWWFRVVDGVEHNSFVREDGGNIGAGATEGAGLFRRVTGTKYAGLASSSGVAMEVPTT